MAGKLRAASSSKDVFSENREVTLLYISLTCASAPNVDLDEEEIYFSRDNLLKQLSNIVKKYDGTLEKFTSHGLVAFFGAPVAHENDPERAVRAALDMQKLIQARQRELAAETDLSLSARIGLHTGSVVAGAIGSKNIHMDYTVVGNAVQVTQEIEQSAAAGDIVISNDTYRHVRSICECVALLPINLPDPPIVIQRFKVAGLLDNAEMSDPLMPPTLMIGRARELGQLQTALAAVIGQERSQAVLITGAAGLGKSRLVTEFRHLVNGPNKVLFLQGTCPAYTRALPLG
ncbi:MAG: hypothetical protein Kow0031_00040 [Anaerolineae bacterium]